MPAVARLHLEGGVLVDLAQVGPHAIEHVMVQGTVQAPQVTVDWLPETEMAL